MCVEHVLVVLARIGAALVGMVQQAGAASIQSVVARIVTGSHDTTRKQGFREFQAARRTSQGYEAMHMIRKGKARWVGGSDVWRQIQFINKLFEVAA